MAKEKKKLPLAAYIFAGLVLGILAGAALMKTPEIAVEYIKPFGTLFLNLVKFIVVPIVLFSIMSGVISMQDMRKVGSIGGENRLLLYVYNGDGSADWPGDCEPLQGFFPPACDIGTGI